MKARTFPVRYNDHIRKEIAYLARTQLETHTPNDAARELHHLYDQVLGAWADNAVTGQPAETYLAEQATITWQAAAMIDYSGRLEYLNYWTPAAWRDRLDSIIDRTTDTALTTGDWQWAVTVAENLLDIVERNTDRNG